MTRLYQKLGPLAPLGAFFVFCIAFFAVNRAGLSLYFADELQGIEQLWRIYPIGLRMDAVLLSAALLLPALLMLLLPLSWQRRLHVPLTLYFSAWVMLIIGMEVVTGPFMNEYTSRPNQLFFQYFTHPKEVLLTVWGEYPVALPMLSLLWLAFGVLCWQAVSRLLRAQQPWPVVLRLLVLPLLIVLLIIGMRSGINKATPNPGLAAFSGNPLANQLGLNSSYSLLYALYRQNQASIIADELYGSLPDEEVFTRVRRAAHIDGPQDATLPTLHQQTPAIARDKPLNLVVIIMESMGAEYMASLGGLPLTPNLEKLAEQGTLFSQLYATGIRTSRGMEALLSAYPPTTWHSTILKLNKSQQNFFTIGSLLKQHGYHTRFIYSGESHFDNMRGFMLNNGFDEVLDTADFPVDAERTSWGASDEALFRFANEKFKQTPQPFANVVLTLTNHAPYDFPEGKIDNYDQPRQNPHNSAKYADYALGKFFEQAQKEAYFANTVFLLVADHPMLVRATELVPVQKYQIVGLLLGPNVPKQRLDTLSSQIDLLPTALSAMGLENHNPMIGRDLLSLPANDPGRAIMQYDNNHAYQVGDQVVIHTPENPAQQFRVVGDQLQPVPLDPELAKDALAHALFPGAAYEKQLYRLP
ncbi:MAG: LTA synthase family protein [Gammaproteobacteria bacterium]|nr:LTA synthase family protein [Gammaproteobacteria bacterium]